LTGHPLAALLDDVAAGRFPAADGSVSILPQPSPKYAGVFAFTAHCVIFADADPAWIRSRDHGLGRTLVTAARHLVPGGAPLWAQIAPGNAASVRAFLAAGFAPVGGEALLLRVQ
jgi:hypothetical protein